jgi:putative DNA primase/helicase
MNNYSTTHQNTQQTKNTKDVLTFEHLEYLLDERNLPAKWLKVNFESLTQKEAQEMGFSTPSDGILLKSSAPSTQLQFRPDKPKVERKSDGTERAIKYVTPSGCEIDAMLPNHPDYPDLWTNPEELKKHCWTVDGHPCLLITEGFIDALIPTSEGVPTIALTGVENGLTGSKHDKEGKRFLVAGLRRHAELGLGFIIGFDADSANNRNVINAQIKLAKQLQLFDNPVYNITGLWTMTSDGSDKGIGDYIQKHGADAFEQNVLRRAEPIVDWLERVEQQFKKETTHKGKPTPQTIAKGIAEEYQPTWRFSDEEQVWRFWNGKYWEKKSKAYVRTSVKSILDSREVRYERSAFITDTVEQIKDDLTTFNWETFDRSQYIAFDNGVLEVETKKLLPHQPGYSFTSVLPYEYNPLKPIEEYSSVIEALKTECPATCQFMSTAMKGDETGIKKLLAVINSVITFKLSKLQMFVHFCGLPGTGKGTMTRLIQKCVGKNNYKGSNIKSLSKPDEIANVIDKQLVVLPDERTDTTVDAILGLTGNDEMSYRQLFKEGASGIFHGSIVVSSNTPLFAGHTIGLDRRTCMISFNNTIPDDKRDGSIEELMDNEIAQLIAVSLMLSDTEVATLIRGIGDANVPSFKLHQWRLKLESDSVASFFNEMIIVDPDGSISGNSLYKEAYRSYCDENGLKALANNKFPERFTELLRVIGVTVEKKSKANRVTWHGIRLRQESEETLTYEEQLEEQVKQVEESRQKAKTSPGNTRSDTSSTPDDVPAQSQTESESLPATPACEVDNTKIDSKEPNHQNLEKSDPSPVQKVGPVGKQHHPFKEKDRVTYYDQNIKGLMDATVIEVKFTPDKKNRGEYVIRYESGFKVDVFGTQINLKT